MCFGVLSHDEDVVILLMEEIRLTTWDVKNPIKHGISTILTG